MAIPSSSATVPSGTTEIRFSYQISTTSTSSLDAWLLYKPITRWLDSRDELQDTARQRQRAAWFAPQKVRVMAPVPPVRRYQKMFQKHLFPPGRKK